MVDPDKAALAAGGRRLLVVAALGGALALFLAVGGIGLYRYLDGFWLYRGFPPPREPAFVRQTGQVDTIRVKSAAVGGREQRVLVYLPPGYGSSTRRYPVLYLLHGFPGNPDGFVRTVRVGVVEDTLLAEHRVEPTIIVMPFGSTGTFTDKAWANGTKPNEKWATFLWRDVVQAIDARYRTIPDGGGRALGGLSEGGYASLNIGFHHPREFRVLESWSGYEKADDIKSIFGGKPALLKANSPLLTVAAVAPALRRDHDYVWFYSGKEDSLKPQNLRFAADLRRLHVLSKFFLVPGGHNWSLWRNNAPAALIVASERLAHG
jgi:enterochelin esterase-like enzyme